MKRLQVTLLALARWAVPIGLVALLAVAAWAQTSPGHDLSWHVLGSGGPDTASAGHLVRGTLGQLAAGPVGSADHAAGSGYWYGIGRPYQVYLPLVLRNW